MVLIGGDRGTWSAQHADAPHRHTNGIYAWVHAFGGRYVGPPFSNFAALQENELVIANLEPTLLREFRRLATSRPKGVQWVSLIEGSAERYFEPMSDLAEILDASDLVMTVNARTEAFFQAMTTTPVKTIGIPYPVEHLQSIRQPYDKNGAVLVCPMSLDEPSLLVASALDRKIIAFAPKLSRKAKNVKRFIASRSTSSSLLIDEKSNRYGQNSEIFAQTSVEQFWEIASQCSLWINLDPRWTWSRYVLDAAALGIPMLTTVQTVHGQTLFPQTTVNSPFDVPKAVEIGRRILADDPFCDNVRNFAQSRLGEYGREPTMARIRAALR